MYIGETAALKVAAKRLRDKRSSICGNLPKLRSMKREWRAREDRGEEKGTVVFIGWLAIVGHDPRVPVCVERVECIAAMVARADPRSPVPLARSARPRLGTVGQVGRSRNAQTADRRALRLRNPRREKVSPPAPCRRPSSVPPAFKRSHLHIRARDLQLDLPRTVYKQILPPFEAADPACHPARTYIVRRRQRRLDPPEST